MRGHGAEKVGIHGAEEVEVGNFGIRVRIAEGK